MQMKKVTTQRGLLKLLKKTQPVYLYNGCETSGQNNTEQTDVIITLLAYVLLEMVNE